MKVVGTHIDKPLDVGWWELCKLTEMEALIMIHESALYADRPQKGTWHEVKDKYALKKWPEDHALVIKNGPNYGVALCKLHGEMWQMIKPHAIDLDFTGV
ncbi:hypothetical protein BH09PAT2_BH09PAT2_05330 [soil metagenome]